MVRKGKSAVPVDSCLPGLCWFEPVLGESLMSAITVFVFYSFSSLCPRGFWWSHLPFWLVGQADFSHLVDSSWVLAREWRVGEASTGLASVWIKDLFSHFNPWVLIIGASEFSDSSVHQKGCSRAWSTYRPHAQSCLTLELLSVNEINSWPQMPLKTSIHLAVAG